MDKFINTLLLYYSLILLHNICMGKELVKKQKDINLRQARWLTEYAKSGNGRQAAIKAGYSPTTASNWKTQILKSVAMQDLMAAQGLDNATLNKELQKMIDTNPKTPLKHSDKLNAIKLAHTLAGNIGQDNKQGVPIVNVVSNYYDKNDETEQSIKLEINPDIPSSPVDKPAPPEVREDE